MCPPVGVIIGAQLRRDNVFDVRHEELERGGDGEIGHGRGEGGGGWRCGLIAGCFRFCHSEGVSLGFVSSDTM